MEEEKKNKQLTQELNDAQNKIQNLNVSKYITNYLNIINYNLLIFLFNFKNEKVKLESGKENSENDQNNNLQKSNELPDIKFIQKSNDIMNVTKVCHYIIINHYVS